MRNPLTTMQASAVEILGRTPLFCDLPPEALARLALGARLESYTKGRVVFYKGDPCHGFHLVLDGQVKLAFVAASGQQKVADIIPAGKSFGQAVMFMQSPHILTAQALTDCQLLFVSKEVILEEIQKNPDFSLRLIACLSMRLHQLIKDFEIHSLYSGRERIVAYLLGEIAGENDTSDTRKAKLPNNANNTNSADSGDHVEICLPTQKANIASRLNLTQEHFSRILHEIAADGLIRIEGRRITLLHIEKLHASLGVL